MSGGAYNYAFHKIENLSDEIAKTTPIRRAFCHRLRLVAEACRAIEWVDSSDSSPGDENQAICDALGPEWPAYVLAETVLDARRALNDLAIALAKVEEKCKP